VAVKNETANRLNNFVVIIICSFIVADIMKQIYTKKMNLYSESEKSLWLNPEIFHLKKNIIDKICGDGAAIIEHIKTTDFFKHTNITFQNPKISKGENYNGLPWVMLDFPCIFGADHIFAFRIFFYWGKEINCFLILKGNYLNQFLETIKRNISTSDFNDVLIYNGNNLWQHHIDENFIPLPSNTEIDELAKQQFLKFAIQINADEIENMFSLGCNAWQVYSKLLS
jgi:hypothetical protein